MPEIFRNKRSMDWICRILMIADMAIILSGYFSWFQSKRQLVSPLIPRSTIAEIFLDSGDLHFKASLLAGTIFLVGLLFYTFKKELIALILFAGVILVFSVYPF